MIFDHGVVEYVTTAQNCFHNILKIVNALLHANGKFYVPIYGDIKYDTTELVPHIE